MNPLRRVLLFGTKTRKVFALGYTFAVLFCSWAAHTARREQENSMNITTYTEFQDIKIGAKFIDSEGFEYRKVSAEEGRYYDAGCHNGHVDYKFSAEDRLRVQPA